MNYIKQSIWAFAAIALIACSSDDDKDTTESLSPVVNTSTSFTANIDAGNSASSKATRTTLVTDADVPYPVWAEGDQLHIYNATTPDNALFSLKSTEYVGQRQGVFDGTITKNAGDKFFALYCSTLAGNGAPTLTASNGSATISATIPATQPTTPGFNPNLHFMTACTTGNTFKFKNAMSLIKISITENMMPGNSYQDFVIRRIRFKANKTSENIAGTFTATIGNDGTLGDYTITNGSNEITIGDGATELAVGDYYIAILPCDFSEGFTLAFEDELDYSTTRNNLKVYDRIRETTFNVGASEIINLGSYTAKECAREAYVDLGITNSSGQKVLWCIQDVYDRAGEAITGSTSKTKESDLRESFYAWGETYVKSNQYKEESICQNYSWYYTYSLGVGSDDSTLPKRSYKYGIGKGQANDAWNATNRWYFNTSNYRGVLLKYNSDDYYTSSVTDWSGGKNDGLTELVVADDAAYQKTNGRLRIPSEDDFQALIDAIDAGKLEYTRIQSGLRGDLFKFKSSTSDRFICLNARGYRHSRSSTADPVDNSTSASEPKGYYWTRDRCSDAEKSYQARSLKITRGSTSGMAKYEIEDAPRCQGRLLRGVIYR